MSRYRLNAAGEWVRVEPEPPKPPLAEAEPSMADYIRQANQSSPPSVEAQRHEWKMEGDLPPTPKRIETKQGPRGGRYIEATTKDGRLYRRYF